MLILDVLTSEYFLEYLQGTCPVEALALAQVNSKIHAACIRYRGRVLSVVPVEPNRHGNAEWEVTIEYPVEGGGLVWNHCRRRNAHPKDCRRKEGSLWSF